MGNFSGTLIGKTIRAALRFRRGGGQALPGLVIARLFPAYVPSMLAKLPGGVVIITGTNGKTTTTKLTTEILKASGLKVLTNPTGSNLVRGIASSLAQHARWSGRLPYDIAVLEVDEAAAKAFTEMVAPRWTVALNVSRDQLDRFGEVDTIATYIKDALGRTTEGVIINANDPNLKQAARGLKIPVRYFGASGKLKKYFPDDYELAAVDSPVKSREKPEIKDADVELADFRENHVKFRIDGKLLPAELKLSGQHNYLNGAAALALCRKLLPAVPPKTLVSQLAEVELAFGRGEKFLLKNGAEIELVLVKNPASFTQALASYNAKDANLMIAINDNIADGRDVSWLWDVNFAPLGGQTVFLASGKRAADMALRLSYDDIKTANIEPALPKAVKLLAEESGPKVILSTYTAMLQLYKLLLKHGWKAQ